MTSPDAFRTSLTPAVDELVYIPLGGTGEIGINMNLYGHDGAFIMADCGMMLDREREGTVLLPDPDFALRLGDSLKGILLTHAHLDHIGAVPDLLPRLGCPVYATPFTAAVLRQLALRGDSPQLVDVHELAPGTRHQLGPFDVEWVTLTHSTLEMSALMLRTPAGNVFHTGDWKLDDDPVLGDHYDEQRLRGLRRDGVRAIVCDSTNAMETGSTGSEGSLLAGLRKVVSGAPGRVMVSCFSSNIARLLTIARVAHETGRYMSIHGRAMDNMLSAARLLGYWPPEYKIVPRRDVGYLPANEVLSVVTGSQGEPRAALARLASDTHPELLLEPSDTVVFSSRRIPGNEAAIDALQQRMRLRGVDVVTEEDELIHVSGHPSQDELSRLFDWLRPQVVVPTHGEPQHLEANADFARRCGVPHVVRARNGDIVSLSPGQAHVAGRVRTGRIERVESQPPESAGRRPRRVAA